MRIFKNIALAAIFFCFAAGYAFAQAGGYTYPGGNIVYNNPGQVYPPPQAAAQPGYAGTGQGNVLPPAPMASATDYQQPPVAASSAQAAEPQGQYAPTHPQADPQSGSFRPGVSLGEPNPHTNYIGDSEWKHFAQRTASFGGVEAPVVYSSPAPQVVTPAPAPKAQAKAKPKPKAKAKPKAKPKPAPVADVPKRPMNDQEREQFCLDYIELCKDYFK